MKRRIYVFLVALFVGLPFCWGDVPGDSVALKAEADNAYQQKDYPQATKLYESFLETYPMSASVNYNLGNCYYQLHNYPQAILHYERALKMSPADDDARFNLALARTKIEDQFGESSEMFFIRWVKQWRDQGSADAWAVWSVCLFGGSLCLFFFYLFVRQVRLRKVCFFSSILLFLFSVVSHVFGYQQNEVATVPQKAVVMQVCPLRPNPSATVKENFDLHPGTTVKLVDTSIKDWAQVELSDGRTGWVATEMLVIV